MQYAFIPENNECHGWPPRQEDDVAKPPLVACTEWRLRVNYKLGKGRQDIGIPYGAGCGGYRLGISVTDDDCTSNIELYDAASQIELSESERRGIPLKITRNGHRVAYFSKKQMKFVAWDLPSAQLKPISPRLDAVALGDVLGLEVSPDGQYFAVTFGGHQPRVLLTGFATGQTTTLQGHCRVLGISKSASRIAVQRPCGDNGDDKAPSNITILNRDGTTLSDWAADDYMGDLSPDGRCLVEITAENDSGKDEHLVTRDAKTGKVIRTLRLKPLSEPSEASGYGWLNASEYIIEASPPEPGGSFGYYRVNVQTGTSHRIRDLGLDPGGNVSLGVVFVQS